MNIEDIRDYCLSMPGVTESFPFNETTLVFKVMGKMFCLANLDGQLGILLKNSPEKVMDMRERFSCVLPGHHMNKIHWNLVLADHSIPDKQFFAWIDESYESVAGGLTRKLKEELQKINRND